MGGIRRPSRTEDSTAELVQVAEAAGITVGLEAISRFELYLDTLLFWRARLSLTAAATRLAVIRAHIADSLYVAPLIDSGDRVADLGSGAGFPGVPLAIVRPTVRVTLIESRRKRANFLRDVVRCVNLPNVDVVEARAEDLPDTLDQAFDVTVSRAVWRSTEFLQISRKLLHDGGFAIAMKGAKALAQLGDSEHGFSKPRVEKYKLPEGAQHALLVYRKMSSDLRNQ